MSDNENNSAAAATPAKSGNGMGIAALILGIIALGTAFIPLVGIFLIWVPAIVGIVLGIVALVKKNAKKVVALIGLILAVVAIPVGIATFAAGVAGVGAAVNESIEESQVSEVVYELNGTGGTANVTYSAWVDGKSTSKSEEVTLPWSLTINPEQTEGEFNFSSFSVSATSGDFSSDAPVDLSCKITADGEVVAESSDNAPYASVSCFG